MKASIVELRYQMKDILKALDRNEVVTIMYRGQEKGQIIPTPVKTAGKVVDHPFFGMQKDKTLSVEEEMQHLRGTRYDDI